MGRACAKYYGARDMSMARALAHVGTIKRALTPRGMSWEYILSISLERGMGVAFVFRRFLDGGAYSCL